MRLARWVALLVLCVGASAVPPAAKLKLVSFTPGQLDLREGSLPASIPHYDLPANRLIFAYRQVHLVVEVGFDRDDYDYRINGLLNPDIQLVRGAHLTIVVVSLGAPGQFLIRNHPPPFGRLMPGDPWARTRQIGKVKFPILPPLFRGSSTAYTVTEVLVAETAGVAWWGGAWANRGCYGRIIVVP